MSNRRDERLDLPYGRWAAWGVAVSAVLTLSAVLFAPLSPVRLAREAVDAVRTPGTRAAAATARGGPEAARSLAERERWPGAAVAREIRAELGPELRTRVRREMRRELRRALEQGLEAELRGSLVQVLGLRAAVGPTVAPFPPLTIGL